MKHKIRSKANPNVIYVFDDEDVIEDVTIWKDVKITASMEKKQTLKNVGDDILYIGRFDPRNADNRFSSDMSIGDGANIEAVRPKAKRPKTKTVIENTKPEL